MAKPQFTLRQLLRMTLFAAMSVWCFCVGPYQAHRWSTIALEWWLGIFFAGAAVGAMFRDVIMFGCVFLALPIVLGPFILFLLALFH